MGTYIFVDGSYLFKCINSLWKKIKKIKNKPLDINRFSTILLDKWKLDLGLQENEKPRVLFYIKKDDKRLDKMIIIPDTSSPGEKNYWQIVDCAEANKTLPAKAKTYIEEAPAEIAQYMHREEKGLDTKLICDALLLSATNKTTKIVLLINDSDYVPLLDTLQRLGTNVYVTNLHHKHININKKLTEIADRYLTLDQEIEYVFGIDNKEDQTIPLQSIQ